MPWITCHVYTDIELWIVYLLIIQGIGNSTLYSYTNRGNIFFIKCVFNLSLSSRFLLYLYLIVCSKLYFYLLTARLLDPSLFYNINISLSIPISAGKKSSFIYSSNYCTISPSTISSSYALPNIYLIFLVEYILSYSKKSYIPIYLSFYSFF